MNWQQVIDRIAEDDAAAVRTFNRRMAELVATREDTPAVGGAEDAHSAASNESVADGVSPPARTPPVAGHGRPGVPEKTVVPVDWDPGAEKFPMPRSWLV